VRESQGKGSKEGEAIKKGRKKKVYRPSVGMYHQKPTITFSIGEYLRDSLKKKDIKEKG